MKHSFLKITFTIICLLSISGFSFSAPDISTQSFDTIQGKVIDSESLESIPFVNIWIEGSAYGTTSDTEGNFNFKIDSSCTLNFSSVGYQSVSQKFEHGEMTEITVELTPDVITLEEVEVRPDYSYDIQMFKKVLAHKNDNNTKLNEISNYENFDRTSVLFATDSTHSYNRLLKKDQNSFIQMENDDHSYIPVYMRELHSAIEVNNENESSQTLDNFSDGIFPNMNNKLESFILEKLAREYNFYKNQITILDRGFRSPLSSNALMFYRIYLSDSLMVDGTKHYKFSFYPKSKRNTVFKGNFWVEDESFALISIDAHMASKANINFVNDLHLKVNYEKQDDGIWFYKDQFTMVNMSWYGNDFMNASDSINTKQVESGNMIVNRSMSYVVRKPSAEKYTSHYATEPLQYETDSLDILVKNGITDIKENPLVKQIDKIGNMFISGYYNMGKFEIGPIFDIHTTNYIEGQRITIPIRTSDEMFKNFTLGGYLGYGFKNEALKFGLSTSILLPGENRTIISARYSDDFIESSHPTYTKFIQENAYSKGAGDIISSITSKSLNPYVFQQQSIELELKRDLSDNIGFYFSPYYHNSYSSEHVQFRKDDIAHGNFVNHGALMNFRFSFGQTYEEFYFSRIYYGNTKPVLNISLDFGETSFANNAASNNNFYIRSNVSMKQRVNLGQSYIRYMVSGGYIFGNVPYTMLENPSSSNSLGYSRYSYNLLNFASYAHNLYANVHLSLNGGGIILNHIPGLSALKLREMVSLKAYYGMKTNGVKDVFDIPDYYQEQMSLPYVELGLGLTNIFKVFRIEYVQRLSNSPEFQTISSQSGIRMRFETCF